MAAPEMTHEGEIDEPRSMRMTLRVPLGRNGHERKVTLMHLRVKDGKNHSREIGHGNLPCAAFVENRVKPLDEPPLQATWYTSKIIQSSHVLTPEGNRKTEVKLHGKANLGEGG